MSYWLTYILLPVLGAALVMTAARRSRPTRGRRPWAALVEGAVSAALVGCLVLNALELVKIASVLTLLGRGVFGLVLTSQSAGAALLGLSAARRALPGPDRGAEGAAPRLARAERLVGVAMLLAAFLMLLVRGRILKLF